MQKIPPHFEKLLNEKETNFISQQISSPRYFFNKVDFDQNQSLHLVCAGRENCNPTYLINRKNFIYYAIEYIPEGEWVYTYNSVKYNFKGNALFAYNHDTNYTLESKNDKPTRKFFIDFIGKDAKKLIEDTGLEFGKPVKILQSVWINNIASMILNCDTFDPQSAYDISTNLLHTFLYIIKSDLKLTSKSSNSIAYESFLKCKTYINENFLQIEEISDITQNCNIEYSYLSKLFKKYASTTPMNFVTRLKMHFAADVIAKDSLSIKEISNLLKFPDQYKFSRTFKRIMGTPPSSYRG